MQSNSESYFDVLELAKELRNEKLFIQSELESIRKLNEKLEKNVVELAQATWTSTQQRSNVKQLFAQGDPSSSTCCQRIDHILSPIFVDAHKVLRYQDALVLSDLIQRVRASPTLVSLWLAAADLKKPTAAAAVARVLCGGLYIYDISPLRKILYHLAKHRLATAEDPRRVISQGSSSFSRLYCELVDGFKPARLFLAAALRGPMLPLLQIDECLIIDPDKALDRVKKLFKSNSPNTDWQPQLSRYRKWTVSTLVTSTGRFVSSLRELWMCFPPSIAWVVRQTALALQTNQAISEEDIYSICIDLVFTNFICQAIIHPEAYGITDVPITNISRFNLIQVSQTIQTLCLMKYQEVDGKFRDFYTRFEKDCVYSMLDTILENESYSAIPNESLSFNGSETSDLEDIILEGAACESEERDILKMEPVINHNIALFTRNDLHLLVSLLKLIPISNMAATNALSEQINCLKMSSENIFDKRSKDYHKNDIPDKDIKLFNENAQNDSETACGISTEETKTENKTTDLAQDEDFNMLLKNLNPDHISKLQRLLEKLSDSTFNWEGNGNKKSSGSSSKGKFINNSPTKNGPKNKVQSSQSQEVLVIKLPGDTAYEPIGLLPECKVLDHHYSTMISCRTLSEEMLRQESVLPNSRSLELLEIPRPNNDVAAGNSLNNPPVNTSSGPHPGQEKRTRFSLSHDEGSIGNTSDNLEAVSEAASNHSVASSLEMETEDQNDNLSDMVSANVSGRGSPNISGRDTPSSQVTEGDAGVSTANAQPLRQPSVTFNSTAAANKQAKLLKRTRHDIEDKFCKFEIKKLIEGDETISIMSDTWSTDVLASDSETIGESTYDRNFITTHFSQQAIRSAAPIIMAVITPSQPDASETASESAWSTDVLVSDVDRMTEVDVDDCNSITRSDTDMGRSESEIASVSTNNLAQDNQTNSNNHYAQEASNVPLSSLSNSMENNVPLNSSNSMRRNVSTCNSISPAILITSNPIPLDSPIYENPSTSSADIDIIDGNLMNSPEVLHNCRKSSNFCENDYKEDDNRIDINGRIHLKEYPQFGSNLNSDDVNQRLPLNSGPSASLYKYANGKIPNMSDTRGFDYLPKENFSNNRPVSKSDINNSSDQTVDNGLSSFLSNGNATIRWLNDPSQKFPLWQEAKSNSNNNATFDYESSNFTCPEVMNSFCNRIEKLNLKPESVFKPIQFPENRSNNDDCIKKSMSSDKIFYMNNEVDKKSNTKGKGGQKKGTHNMFDSDIASILGSDNKNVSELNSVTAKPSSNIYPTNSSTIKTADNFINHHIGNNISNKQNDKSPNKLVEDKNDSSSNDINSSGSAISLSTLSVNSVDTSTSDKSSSQEVNSENLTERRITPPPGNVSILTAKDSHIPVVNDGANTLPRQSSVLGTNTVKPGSSTGAIPKSISFDATAEKTHRYHSGRRLVEDASEGISINFGEFKNNVKRSGGNLLNKIKMFRKSRGHTGISSGYGKRTNQNSSEDLCKSGRELDGQQSDGNQNETVNILSNSSMNIKSNNDLSDDILAKYRRKASSSSDAANSDSTSHSGSIKGKNRGNLPTCEDTANVSDGDSAVDRNSDLEFESLRRELRLVLSNMEVNNIELASGCSGSLALACALRLEGAGGALGALCALGNLGSLDSSRGPVLLNALRADLVARRPYISYLAKCRRSLLSAIATLESECAWQTNEIHCQSALAASARARASLAAKESRLAALQEKLRSGLVDERRDALMAALNTLASEMAAEDVWAGASEWELEQAALTIERVVMGRVYIQAMFPNGDGDIMRDQLLHEHMTKLGANGFGLPTRRLTGAPWTPAQRILAHLPAYKTPRDKVDCIVRCVNSIVTLLSMTSEGSTPGADDLTPVLVYILIKTNPPSLLSTVQFVTTFITTPLEGERLYCWTQFCAAIEYIKTMD